MPDSTCSRPGCEEEGPLSNISAEEADAPVFVGTYFGNTPLGPPPLGRSWTAFNCNTTCVSTESQEDADLCAARAASACNNEPPPSNPPGDPPPTNPPPPFGPPPTPDPPQPPSTERVCNTEQSAVAECPDGTEFNFTVPAGRFCAVNQAIANSMAQTYARRRAFQQMICLGISGTFDDACLGQFYTGTITASGNTTPLTFLIVSGSIPTGLVASQSIDGRSFTLFGTPTTIGTFSFQIRATDAFGNFMTVAYTISVINIITATELPEGIVGLDYSATLTSAGGVAPLIWHSVSGGIPPGTSLFVNTGVIAGVPTEAGEYEFTLSVTDANGSSCNKEFTILIEDEVPCPTFIQNLTDGTMLSPNHAIAAEDLGRVLVVCDTTSQLQIIQSTGESDAIIATNTFAVGPANFQGCYAPVVGKFFINTGNSFTRAVARINPTTGATEDSNPALNGGNHIGYNPDRSGGRIFMCNELGLDFGVVDIVPDTLNFFMGYVGSTLLPPTSAWYCGTGHRIFVLGDGGLGLVSVLGSAGYNFVEGMDLHLAPNNTELFDAAAECREKFFIGVGRKVPGFGGIRVALNLTVINPTSITITDIVDLTDEFPGLPDIDWIEANDDLGILLVKAGTRMCMVNANNLEIVCSFDVNSTCNQFAIQLANNRIYVPEAGNNLVAIYDHIT